MNSAIYETVVGIIVNTTWVSADMITPDSSFECDLEINDWDLLDIIFELENEYGVEVPDQDRYGFSKVRDIVDFIEGRLAQGGTRHDKDFPTEKKEPAREDHNTRRYAMTEKEMVETKHDLLTTKYTKVLEEKDFNFNAPHLFEVVAKESGEKLARIHFQEGPIKENGVNGLCNEDLIVMVIRRLEGFQQSQYACRDNAVAITKLEEALLWLRKRTMARENRGVEGTSAV